MAAGYYRYPTISGDTVVFVCEDDLWTVPAQGGVARRLTSNLGEVSRPVLSPDGRQLAFVGQEEGDADVYLMPAVGGPARRLTYLGGSICQTVGWTRSGKIVFANTAGHPFAAMMHLYVVDTLGNPPERLEVGPARTISSGPRGGIVIGRNTADPARWKRYRGGTAGQLWIDQASNGEFRPLIQLKGNLASPMWIGDRIYFISDHEGIGNIYSCLPSGDDLRRHTDHDDFYARNASTDGKRIIYHAGADLYLFDPQDEKDAVMAVEYHSPRVQRNRKFVEAGKYLQDWALNPAGDTTATTSRGKAFAFRNWEGAVITLGEADGVRYRLPTWLYDGKRLVAATDSQGEEAFVILRADGNAPPDILPGLDIGRPVSIAVNPQKDEIAFSNHRYELMVLDLATRELRKVDRGHSRRISGFDWSPDGRWLAYSLSISLQVEILKLWKAETGETFPITEPVLRDVQPAFDPDGRYLYFLSYRHFDPVPDNLHFDYSFPRGMKPFLVTLERELTSPFLIHPEPVHDKDKKDTEQAKDTKDKEEKEEVKPVRIDLEGISTRIVAFPVDEGLYGRIAGLKGGKVLYSRYPVEGALSEPIVPPDEPPAKGTLYLYSFVDHKQEAIVSGISDFGLSRDACLLIYRAGNRLRVLKAGEKPDKEAGDSPSRASGWIDLSRIKVSVLPGAEWRQMFREAWRLQRDYFWTPDMQQVDWLGVHDRYLPLADRVASRSEFSDLMWEMQGELGTSHAYEFGGDYRPKPSYAEGHLGAEFEYDQSAEGWRIKHLMHGDPWDAEADSPLNGPGVNAQVGDLLLAINGKRLSGSFTPEMALVNQAGTEVALTIATKTRDGGEPRVVTVKTLHNEMPLHYREWVETNRRKVHQATEGRVGYVHIPDMGARGFAEFSRGYLAEVDREGLIVDLRFNSGGIVSPLILEMLARRRIGYDTTRWGQELEPYPPESASGPMVALTNEWAGSDGDIFSHGFKLLKLGPLVGKRTWGGVIGYWPRNTLVDGTLTTQPELSFWFEDVGWTVENYGVDPDIEVENRPQDYARGVDAQLQRSIEEVLKLLKASQPKRPSQADRPSRARPKLPAK